MLGSPLRSTSVSILMVIVVLLVAIPRTARPYEIGPYPQEKVHETLTLMASDCLRRAPQDTGPLICSPSPAAVMDNKALKNTYVNIKGLGNVSAKQLAHAVRWPDDPTREVGIRGIWKFLVKMLWHQCAKRYTGGMQDGLLCSSHHGPLQFWHAMASTPTESTEETQRKVLAWAEFLYEVAVGGVNLDDEYCTYWRKQEEQGKNELASILAPRDKFPCVKDGSPWKIRTLFSMTCKNPFSSETCDVAAGMRVARLNALGALLHVVQDSYAQGHAARGSAEKIAKRERIKSKFECLPIKQFYTYCKQDDGKHSEADAPPQPGLSCASTSTILHDPLASANASEPTIVDDPILAFGKSALVGGKRERCGNAH